MVKLGSYHTLELEPHRAFTLAKEVWDRLDIERSVPAREGLPSLNSLGSPLLVSFRYLLLFPLFPFSRQRSSSQGGMPRSLCCCPLNRPPKPRRRIKTACDLAARADVAALMLQEGFAQLVLVGGNVTLVRAKIEANLPRKRGAEAGGYDKALEKFFARCLEVTTTTPPPAILWSAATPPSSLSLSLSLSLSITCVSSGIPSLERYIHNASYRHRLGLCVYDLIHFSPFWNMAGPPPPRGLFRRQMLRAGGPWLHQGPVQAVHGPVRQRGNGKRGAWSR